MTSSSLTAMRLLFSVPDLCLLKRDSLFCHKPCHHTERLVFNKPQYSLQQQRVRYDDCSNGALIFDPATGTNVNGGIFTVSTTADLNGITWQSCSNITINGANGIDRDYTMIFLSRYCRYWWRSCMGTMSW
jgi:hypothetical protein